MWPGPMPLARGARPVPGMRGFPPMMIGADGFSYGVTPDGFPMPDLFGVAPRPFAPYGPRFSGDFTGPGGMMFPGRPPQPGSVFPPNGFSGMMMGPGRPPFMGGMGPTATNPRGGRPVGVPPPFPNQPQSSQNSSRVAKRDVRGSINDRNDRYSAGSDQGRAQEMGGPGRGPDDEVQYQQEGSKANQEDQYGSRNFRNDESESEDEAPRRSRHGEGKKKRRDSEGDAAASSDN